MPIMQQAVLLRKIAALDFRSTRVKVIAEAAAEQ
jgi:hypothetical protein